MKLEKMLQSCISKCALKRIGKWDGTGSLIIKYVSVEELDKILCEAGFEVTEVKSSHLMYINSADGEEYMLMSNIEKSEYTIYRRDEICLILEEMI